MRRKCVSNTFITFALQAPYASGTLITVVDLILAVQAVRAILG